MHEGLSASEGGAVLMILGEPAGRWGTRRELWAAINGAHVVKRAEVYRSDALRIARVSTLSVGAYFIITESDALYDEDCSALLTVSIELRAPWRNRVVETDYYGHPHRWFPFSTKFWVHVVHPELQPDWEAHERPFFCAGEHVSISQPNRAVRTMPSSVRASAA